MPELDLPDMKLIGYTLGKYPQEVYFRDYYNAFQFDEAGIEIIPNRGQVPLAVCLILKAILSDPRINFDTDRQNPLLSELTKGLKDAWKNIFNVFVTGGSLSSEGELVLSRVRIEKSEVETVKPEPFSKARISTQKFGQDFLRQSEILYNTQGAFIRANGFSTDALKRPDSLIRNFEEYLRKVLPNINFKVDRGGKSQLIIDDRTIFISLNSIAKFVFIDVLFAAKIYQERQNADNNH